MVLPNVAEIAERFAKRTNFKIVTRAFGKPEDGGFFELRNYRGHGPTHGALHRKGEYHLMLHLVHQVGGTKGGELTGRFVFSKKPWGPAARNNPSVTAHPDGTITLEADKLTHAELAFALKHVKTLQEVMRVKKTARKRV